MPDNLSDLFRRSRDPERPNVHEATVASGAGGLNGDVTVTIDGFDGGKQRWPVDGWSPRDGQYPQRGDRALVALSDSNRLWLVQWMPGGGGRGPGGRDAQATAARRDGTTPGVLAGTPRDVIDNIVIPIAVSHGFSVTSESVAAANASHSPTSASGNTSDHAGPDDVRWAADISNGTETPEEDALAEDLANEFGMSWSGSGSTEVTKRGYNIQLIYRTPASSVYGDHTDHVHLGLHVV